MKKLKTLYYLLLVLLTPSCWLISRRYYYSKKWDEILRRLMLTQKFLMLRSPKLDAKDKICTIGEIKLWVSPYPNGMFVPVNTYIRPSRVTMLMARKKLVEDTLEPLIRDSIN